MEATPEVVRRIGRPRQTAAVETMETDKPCVRFGSRDTLLRMLKVMAVFTLMCATSGLANGGPVTWYLHDVSGGHDPSAFPYPGYIWGDFTYDTDTLTLLGWHLYGAPIAGVFPDPLDAQGSGGSINPLEVILRSDPGSFLDGDFSRNHFEGVLTLDLMTPLTDSATLIYIKPYSPTDSYSCECYYSIPGDLQRHLDSGFISTTGPGSAPELATLLYILPSLAAFGRGVVRRRRLGK